MNSKIKVGISSCLLGEKVRFDGGHKKDQYINEILGDYFEFVPACPEVDIGLGTPRESLRLIGDIENPKLITGKTKLDYTKSMQAYSEKKSTELSKAELCGYILKKDSPSCGMVRVRVYAESGIPERKGTGIFARVLMNKHPLLPVEEEGRLKDAKIRENFIARVFCFFRLQELKKSNPGTKEIVEFHTKHKLLIMAHSEVHMRELGRLVAQANNLPPHDFLKKYEQIFFDGIKRKATVKKHANVLQHIVGHFKKHIGPDDKKELLNAIEDYRKQLVPLIVPLTLLRHYVRKFNIEYIKQQHYLNPHPKELMLLNHV